MAEARLARFTPAADVTQLWNEQRLGEDLHLHFPHALTAVCDVFAAGENAGPGSRLFVFDGSAQPRQVAVTGGAHSAFFYRTGVLTVGADAVEWWPVSHEDKRRPRSSNPRAAGKTGQ